MSLAGSLLALLFNAKGVNAQGATTRATSDKIVACRVGSNYPFAKLMEIAESVPQDASDKRQNFSSDKRQIFIISCVRCCDKRQFCRLNYRSRCRSLCVHTQLQFRKSHLDQNYILWSIIACKKIMTMQRDIFWNSWVWLVLNHLHFNIQM